MKYLYKLQSIIPLTVWILLTGAKNATMWHGTC